MGLVKEQYAGEKLDKYAVQSHVIYGFVIDFLRQIQSKRNYQLQEIKFNKDFDTESLINIYMFTFKPYAGNYDKVLPITMYKVEEFDYHQYAGKFCKVTFCIIPKMNKSGYPIIGFSVLKIELSDFDLFNKKFQENGYKFRVR